MSDFECYCEPTNPDGCSDVWTTTHPRARKSHKCHECNEIIVPGETYERIFSIYEGAIEVYKTCEFCAAEIERLRKLPMFEEGIIKGDLACCLVYEMRGQPMRDSE